MQYVQVIGETIEFKGQPVAKLNRLPRVSNTTRAEFVTMIESSHMTDEDIATGALISFRDSLLDQLKAMKADPVYIETIKEMISKTYDTECA